MLWVLRTSLWRDLAGRARAEVSTLVWRIDEDAGDR